MLGPRFQRAEHLRPALAIAVGGAERALVFAPALLGDLDERAPVVERLEAHRHLGAIIAVLLLAALDIVGLAFARLPFEDDLRSEEHTSELQSLMRISYAVFCLKKKNKKLQHQKLKHTNIYT